MPTSKVKTHSHARRRIVRGLTVGALATWTSRVFSGHLAPTPRQTEGPFYPDKLPLDTDNDLVHIGRRAGTATGQVTHLHGRILDLRGQPIADALVEIWQVDANGVYLHSADTHARRDAGFQGYGRFTTGTSGEYRFRTIKPVPYPGRTPHIHFKVTPKDRASLTTQCYVAGEPLNDRDGVLNSIRDPAARASVIVPFTSIPGSAGELSARFDIVLGFSATS